MPSIFGSICLSSNEEQGGGEVTMRRYGKVDELKSKINQIVLGCKDEAEDDGVTQWRSE